MKTARLSRVAVRPFVSAVSLSLLLLGCSRKTPEAACEQLVHALADGDASAVFDSLLQTTQWAMYTVQKNHTQMRSLITQSYPPEQRPAALSRLVGAEADSGRDLFIRLYPTRYERSMQARLGSSPGTLEPTIEAMSSSATGAKRARCQLGTGQSFELQQAASGRWGLAELDREWQEAELRAVHDLATVEKNAQLYRQVQQGMPAQPEPPSQKVDKKP